MIHRASVLTVLTIFSLCCAYPTEAQDKRVLVQKLIEVTDTTSLMKNAAQTAAAAIMNTIKTSNPTISDETFNYIQEKVQTETLGVIKSFMEQLAYPIYEENFSDKELQSVIDFYSSPTGQRFAQMMPLTMKQISMNLPEFLEKSFSKLKNVVVQAAAEKEYNIRF